MEFPDDWTLDEAATVPIAYATAYLSLVMTAHIKKGERVLIHTGASTVGIACISVALHHGCEVYITVGSQRKRDYLKKRFPQLKDTHFSNSRDLTFRDHIRDQTHDKGVKIIVNTLTEEKLYAGMQCLAPNGRFIEIGKFDISQQGTLGNIRWQKYISLNIFGHFISSGIVVTSH